MKSYENYNVAMLILVIIVYGVLVAMIEIDVGVAPVLVTGAVLIALLIIIDVSMRKRFPQWKKLRWKTSWPLVIFLCVLAFVLIFMSDMLESYLGGFNLSTTAVFVIILIIQLQNVVRIKKYHLDRYSSIEELIEACPEVKDKIRI